MFSGRGGAGERRPAPASRRAPASPKSRESRESVVSEPTLRQAKSIASPYRSKGRLSAAQRSGIDSFGGGRCDRAARGPHPSATDRDARGRRAAPPWDEQNSIPARPRRRAGPMPHLRRKHRIPASKASAEGATLLEHVSLPNCTPEARRQKRRHPLSAIGCIPSAWLNSGENHRRTRFAKCDWSWRQ